MQCPFFKNLEGDAFIIQTVKANSSCIVQELWFVVIVIVNCVEGRWFKSFGRGYLFFSCFSLFSKEHLLFFSIYQYCFIHSASIFCFNYLNPVLSCSGSYIVARKLKFNMLCILVPSLFLFFVYK